VGDLVEVRRGSRGDDDVRAAFGEGDRAGGADTPAGTGDDRYLVSMRNRSVINGASSDVALAIARTV